MQEVLVADVYDGQFMSSATKARLAVAWIAASVASGCSPTAVSPPRPAARPPRVLQLPAQARPMPVENSSGDSKSEVRPIQAEYQQAQPAAGSPGPRIRSFSIPQQQAGGPIREPAPSSQFITEPSVGTEARIASGPNVITEPRIAADSKVIAEPPAAVETPPTPSSSSQFVPIAMPQPSPPPPQAAAPDLPAQPAFTAPGPPVEYAYQPAAPPPATSAERGNPADQYAGSSVQPTQPSSPTISPQPVEATTKTADGNFFLTPPNAAAMQIVTQRALQVADQAAAMAQRGMLYSARS